MEDMICTVCSEVYERGVHDPVMLPHCGHTFCRACLLHLQTNNSKLHCPHCRKVHTGPPVEMLFVDYALLRIIERSVKKQACEEVCRDHGDPLILWCRTCKETLCGQCHYDSHMTPGHQVVRPNKVAEELTDTIYSKKLHTMQQCRTMVHGLMVECAKHASVITTVEQYEDDLKKMPTTPSLMTKIESCFSSVTSLPSALLSASNEPDIEPSSTESSDIHEDKMTASSQSWETRDTATQTTATCCMLAQRTAPSATSGAVKASGLSQLAWPLNCWDKRWSRVTLEDDRLHVYPLDEQVDEVCHRVQMPLVQLLASSPRPEVFHELSADQEVIGRVYFRLFGDLRRAQYFLSLCLGTLGPSYRGFGFFSIYNYESPDETLDSPDHRSKNSQFEDIPLLHDFEYGGKHTRPWRAGMLAAYCDEDSPKKDPDYFITTQDQPGGTVDCPFGEVVSGLEVVKEAADHVHKKRKVIVSDCGLVVSDPSEL